MSTRKVTVVSTKTNKIMNYETEATTWGELVETIQKDFELSNLKANENINKTTLEHIDAKLPEGPFRVFLRPVKTKSGNIDFSSMGFKEMRENFVKTGKEIQAFLLSKFGKNWTQLKTVELKDGLTEYFKDQKSSSEVPETANVVEEQPVTTTEDVTAKEFTTDEKLAVAFSFLQDIDITDSVMFQDLDEDEQGEAEVFFEEINSNIDSLIEIMPVNVGYVVEVSAPTTSAPAVVEEVESAEDKAAREAKEEEERLEAERKEAERLENEAILKEAKEFGEGLM